MKTRNIATLIFISFALLPFQNCGPGFVTTGEEGLSSLEVNPFSSVFQCVPSDDPSATPVNRLTKRELASTYQSLIGAGYTAALAQTLDYIPGDEIVSGFDNISLPISEDHVKAYFGLAVQSAAQITKDTTVLKNVVGTCATVATTLNEACVKTFIENFGLKVLRRPVTATEATQYLALYTDAGTTRKMVGLQLVLISMLQSPSFLYKLEIDGALAPNRSDVYQLNGYEIASRLSYLFTGTMPDATLFDAAKSGALDTEAGIKTQTERLIKTAAAKKQFEYFYTQWLHLNDVPEIPSNEVLYDGVIAKGLSAADVEAARTNLQKNAVQETKNFIDHQVWKAKGNYKELLTSNLVFPLTDDMSKLYKTPKIASVDSPVASAEPNRKGLLGRAALLMHDTENSRPILRGVFVRQQILCEPIPTPSDEIIDNARDLPLNLPALATTREDVTLRTAGTACIACHSAINPVGFALEAYDSLGRIRTDEMIFDDDGKYIGKSAIDARVELPINGRVYAVQNPSDLGDAVASNNRGPACMARQWFRFSRGRIEKSTDNCALESSAQSLMNKDKSVQDMLLDTALHPHFSLRKLAP